MMQRSPAPPRAAVAVALVAALGCGLCILLLPDRSASNVSDVAQGAAALAASVAAGWHVRLCAGRRTRATWAIIAAACFCWAAGEAHWCWHTLRSDEIPFPALADVGFLAFSGLMALALLVYPTSGGRVAFLQRMLDGLLTAGSVGLISWLTTLGAVVGADEASTGLERLLLLAYPSTDVLLVVLTVLLLARSGGNRPALYLVSAGVVALGVSDSSFAYLGAAGLYGGGLIDLGWIGGFLLIALAGTCREPTPGSGDASSGAAADGGVVRAAVLPYVPAMGALAVVAGVTTWARPLTTAESLASGLVVLCLLARQYAAVRDNVRLTRELAARERQLRHQAFHDPLTGLANRSLFTDRLEHVLDLHARDCRPVAVLFLDLDGFKEVNDSSGHAAGDALLVRVAERIRGATRTGDTVARLGGDEFAVLLEDAADPLQTAARIGSALQQSFVVAGAEHVISASIGVAAVTADDPPLPADTLLARSDTAMYAAKRAGKAAVVSFDGERGPIRQPGALEPTAS